LFPNSLTPTNPNPHEYYYLARRIVVRSSLQTLFGDIYLQESGKPCRRTWSARCRNNSDFRARL